MQNKRGDELRTVRREAEHATLQLAQGQAQIQELEKRLRAMQSSFETAHHSMLAAQQESNWLRTALAAEQQARDQLELERQQTYERLVQRFIRVVDDVLPPETIVVVVSKGDESLLKLPGRRAWHFPQNANGMYAGHHPADDSAAITQLEALRHKGAQYLIFPATARWWLDHYQDFRRHIEQEYRLLLDHEDTCIVFDLRPQHPAKPARRQEVEAVIEEPQREDTCVIFDPQSQRAEKPAWRQDIEAAIEEFQVRFGRDPVILDFHTNLDLAKSIPEQTIFTPATGDAATSYLDQSIDFVVTPADRRRVKEARRVAKALLGILKSKPEDVAKSDRKQSPVLRLETKWLQNGQQPMPSVSIIIQSHNGVALTKAWLAGVFATLPRFFRGEIVVVDDASSDGTSAMLEAFARDDPRLKILRNRTNVGFLESRNRAARAAKGDLLVFLGRDTVPWLGWLAALLRTMREHPDAGAVGGKLVLPDGALQEAGSIVFRDGSAAGFGRGKRNLDAPLYNFVREVDYCSAALLATPRRLFKQLGGFDSGYSPGCYEDADYCFRIRAKGYRVYYQPASIVTQHEGAPCGTSTNRDAKRYQVLNRRKFARKWKAVLRAQSVRPPYGDLAAWKALALRGKPTPPEDR